MKLPEAITKPVFEKIERDIKAKFGVDTISADQLRQILNTDDSKSLLLLDSRGSDEYAVSHIESAEQVAPSMTKEQFSERFASAVADKNIVVYCSIGYRSSKFIEQVVETAKAHGAGSIKNLKGGIFRWSNQGFPLVNSEGLTEDVHGYNAYWSQFLR